MRKSNRVKSEIFFHPILGLFLLSMTCSFLLPINAYALRPTLNFSDLTSGPKTGNTDGVGSGAIVTVWGNNLGSTQGTSKIYVGNVEATAVYYWKDADGKLPGGPADLKTYHKMQEIAFAVPAGAADGANAIKIVVSFEESNTLPFTVRAGGIKFIKPNGNDSAGTGTWSSPWATPQKVLTGGNGKMNAGDIVYTVGVGSSTSLLVGYSAPMNGTADTPYAFISYPNSSTTFSVIGSPAVYSISNYRGSGYWVFSKFNMSTEYQAISKFQYSRIIGNNVTGPNISSSTANVTGWIGGNCTGASGVYCSGFILYGNEVHNFGKPDGTSSPYQHLYYISNRSGTRADAYEIAWSNHHDNPILHGIHIYDQGPECGGWNGAIKIHHNVVRNQGGNAININVNCPEPLAAEIHDNVIITDPNYNPPGVGSPGAAFRVANQVAGAIKIYNNSVYGYGVVSSQFSSDGVDYRNNLVVDTRGLAFSITSPTTSSNNTFYSTFKPSLAAPIWATGATSNVNPSLLDPTNGDLSLAGFSVIRYQGTDSVLPIAPIDFVGKPRRMGRISIGAIDFDPSVRLKLK